MHNESRLSYNMGSLNPLWFSLSLFIEPSIASTTTTTWLTQYLLILYYVEGNDMIKTFQAVFVANGLKQA
jgi:hypothetical protein